MFDVHTPQSVYILQQLWALAQTLIWTFSGNWDFRGIEAELSSRETLRNTQHSAAELIWKFSDKLQLSSDLRQDRKWLQFDIDVGQEIDPQTGKTII